MREWAAETKWAAPAVVRVRGGYEYKKTMLIALGD